MWPWDSSTRWTSCSQRAKSGSTGPAGLLTPDTVVVYLLDYRYLDGTLAGGIDVFRGSAFGAGVVGAYMAVDRLKRDVEAKILIDCTQVEIVAAGEFLADALHLSPHLVERY